MNAYEDTGLTRKVELLKQLVNIRLESHNSMQEYINDIIMIALKVRNAGLNIDDELAASLMLAGLPNDFRPLVMAVENSKEKLTIDMVKNLLLQDAKFDSVDNEKALYSKNKKSLHKLRCHSCKATGHFSRNCPNKARQKNYSESKGTKNNEKGDVLFAMKANTQSTYHNTKNCTQ